MLTKRQNLIETIRGGKPDRFVNQYEAFSLIMQTPFSKDNPNPAYGEHNVVNAWGITKSWPIGTPGPFPVHDAEHIVIKDITRWRDFVKVPNIIYPAAEWEPFVAQAEKIDRKEQFATFFYAPGIFEQCHYLLEISNCLLNFYEEPEAMHEIIEMITDFEIAFAEQVQVLKPALFHHDDWGTRVHVHLSDMFEEFFRSPTKALRLLQVPRRGTHRPSPDSYAATLVPI